LILRHLRHDQKGRGKTPILEQNWRNTSLSG
jgi:hypothetical protein